MLRKVRLERDSGFCSGGLMAIFNRRATLEEAVDDWAGRGLINSATREQLRQDIALRRPARSFGSIAILLGMICLAFGIMTFVAANWEEMSSLVRLTLVLSGMWAAWAGAIAFRLRGNEWLASTFVMLAAASFGAAIMLIGQIYNIQGDPKGAVWLWAAGALVAAVATRTSPALALAIMLFTLWAFIDPEFEIAERIDYRYLVWWAACAAAAWWIRGRFTAHMLLLGLSVWTISSALVDVGFGPKAAGGAFMMSAMAIAFLLLSLSLWSDGGRKLIHGFELSVLPWAMLVIGVLWVFWYFSTAQWWNGTWRTVAVTYVPGGLATVATAALAMLGYNEKNPNRYDMLVAAVFTAVFTILSTFVQRVPFLMEATMLALAIWTIRMGWRLEYRALSNLGFLGFAGVMLLIYFETVGSLIGTSAFYLGAGIVILLAAWFLPKLMRRGGSGTAANATEGEGK